MAKGKKQQPKPSSSTTTAVASTSSTAPSQSTQQQPTPQQQQAPVSQPLGGGGGGDVVRGRGGYRTKAKEELRTIPQGINSLQGTQGRPLKFLTNYVKINLPTASQVFQYRVDFEPDVESTRLRGQLVREATRQLFAERIIYDNGSDLKSSTQLPQETTTVQANHPADQSRVTITIRKAGQVDWGAFEMLSMYNVAMKNFLQKMGYFQLKKDNSLYHEQLRTQLPGNHGISIIGGYKTSAGRHDGGILMNLESVTRTIQDLTVLQMMRTIHRNDPENFHRNVTNALVNNTTVITRYNNTTYKVEGFKFDLTPESTFEKDGTRISYIEYYKRNWPQYPITDHRQPLILAKLENLHRREREQAQQQAPEKAKEIHLIPELCYITGLTEIQRRDNRIKMDMIRHSQVSPGDRVRNIRRFLQMLHQAPHVQAETAKWNYSYDKDIVKVDGRQMEPEAICWGNHKGRDFKTWPRCDPPGSFDRTLRGATLFEAPQLQRMVFLISRPNANLLELVKGMIQRHIRQLGMQFRDEQFEIVRLADDRVGTYLSACRSLANDTNMVLVLLPNTNKDRYDAIKKVLTVERGIPSQCVTARLMMDDRKANSACQKIAIQIAAKIGGSPWSLSIPVKQIMICGYDTYHDTAIHGRSVGAFCSSLNGAVTRWWSKADHHDKLDEYSVNLPNNVLEGVKRWREANKSLPSLVILYRDGVGEGQLDSVYNIELKKIKDLLRSLGKDDKGKPIIKLTMVIVTKRIGTRFFLTGGPNEANLENPPPGTVVDSVVTRQSRYDFYLVSQLTRQGTVSPTMYNIIEDNSNLNPMHQQMLAYKLCHLYFNWTGTVRVPAPCQYAHKLAYLVGESLHIMPNVRLENYLHYL